MTTKFIPYGRQWIDREEIRAVTAVLKSDFLTQGPCNKTFEEMFAAKVGAKYAVSTSNGTAALHLAALVLNLQPGDEVLTSPISFLATSNAILYAGARPVFVDIDPKTQCIDSNAIEEKITSKTKAIFFTDFAGYPADIKKINSIAKKYHLAVVEDAAHALGSTYQGTKIGSCRLVDMTIFSFHPVKHITTGEGGMITTNHSKYYEQLSELRTHGVTRDPKKLHEKNSGAWYYEMQQLGFNYRMTDLQAALGIEQLKKLDRFVSRRRKIAEKYREAFQDISEIIFPEEQSGCMHVYHLFVIRLQKSLIKMRKKIFEEFRKRGLGVQVHYIPIPSQPYYRKLGYRAEDYPVAQSYYDSAISLPIFPKMTNDDIDFVIKTVRNVFRLYSKDRTRRVHETVQIS